MIRCTQSLAVPLEQWSNKSKRAAPFAGEDISAFGREGGEGGRGEAVSVPERRSRGARRRCGAEERGGGGGGGD